MEFLMTHHLLKSQNPLHTKIYHKGEIIYFEETQSLGLYSILRGTVKIFINSSNGKEIILRLVTMGDIFGQEFLFNQHVHNHSAKAIDETEICFFEKNEVQKKIFLNPELTNLFIKKMGEELYLYQNKCTDLIKKNVRERLASYFLYMAENHSEKNQKGLKIKVQLSREEIASMIGTASETAIRFISEFKELGIIEEEEKFFHILDKQKLSNIDQSLLN